MNATEAPRSVLTAALRLAALGLRVAFAYGVRDEDGCCTCGKSHTDSRSSIGKHPIGKRWQQLASSDPQAVRDAYVEGCNVGIVCGAHDAGFIIAVDVDDEARFASLVADLGELPPTLAGRSPRGARLLFRVPESIPNRTLEGVDIKGSNGFVVVGPSRHHSGAYYTELEGELAELPASWLAYIRPAPKVPPSISTWAPLDKRARTRAQKWAQACLDSECSIVVKSAEGTRNVALYHAALRAFSCYRGAQLSDDDAHAQLVSAGKAVGLAELEVRRTLASAQKHLDETGGKRTPPDRPKLEIVRGPTDVELIEIDGAVAKIEENVSRMMRVYPEKIRFDTFARKILYGKRALIDDDVSIVRGWLHEQPKPQRVQASFDTVYRGIALAASKAEFHPVREYLDAQKWDRTDRVEHFFSRYFGVHDSIFTRTASKLFLLGMIARVRMPGCKLDESPILEGEQGMKKSSALAALVSDAWFRDSKMNLGDKDSYQNLIGVWLYELPELASTRSRDVETVKGFMTARFDDYRPSYGRCVVRVERQCAFVGSTNDEQYLHDHTGNRRWNCLRCTHIDREAIARDRDQIWAEAQAWYAAAPQQWWHRTDEFTAEQRAAAESREVIDPWEAIVLGLEPDFDHVTSYQILAAAGVPTHQQTRDSAQRLGVQLRRGGWSRYRSPIPPRVWLWRRP